MMVCSKMESTIFDGKSPSLYILFKTSASGSIKPGGAIG